MGDGTYTLEGIDAIALALDVRGSRLHLLNLNGNKIGDAGAAAIVDALHVDHHHVDTLLTLWCARHYYEEGLGLFICAFPRVFGFSAHVTLPRESTACTGQHTERCERISCLVVEWLGTNRLSGWWNVLSLGDNMLGDKGAESIAHALLGDKGSLKCWCVVYYGEE